MDRTKGVDVSIDWFKGKITGKSHISWENLWFPVDFPLSQLIELCKCLSLLVRQVPIRKRKEKINEMKDKMLTDMKQQAIYHLN